jgi:glycosyltransferase involved in cell wall biosynthesis
MHRFFDPERWKWRVTRRLRPWLRHNWPKAGHEPKVRAPRIAVVTVNYNTKGLLGRLVFSLRRIVDEEISLGPIVVVDNNSTDGSVPMIRQLAEAGVVEPIFNQRQKYHGPGLNQGIEFLRRNARNGRPGFADIDYVFLVDSDAFICRGEVFSHAIRAMKSVGSPLAGEFVANQYIQGGDAHVSSLLFDPAVSWRRGFHPFEQHGAPALEYQRTVVKRRLIRLDFPFRTNFYVIHLWSGTMKAICSANDRENKYFDWASANLTAESSLDEKTAYILDEFEQRFRSAAPDGEPQALVEACLAPSRLRLARPYELAPQLDFVPEGRISAEGFVAH